MQCGCPQSVTLMQRYRCFLEVSWVSWDRKVFWDMELSVLTSGKAQENGPGSSPCSDSRGNCAVRFILEAYPHRSLWLDLWLDMLAGLLPVSQSCFTPRSRLSPEEPWRLCTDFLGTQEHVKKHRPDY